MTPNPIEDARLNPQEPLLGDLLTSIPVKDAVAFAQRQVTEDVHPAFADTRLIYDQSNDCFATEAEEVYDEAALFDGQRAFADALQQFQQGVKPKYKSQIDLCASHTWDEVIGYADEARRKYTGVVRKGIMRKIDHGLKTFQTAAPAIQAWLKLLPSTTWYGSILCGGLIIVLEAAVKLRKVQEETLEALDQVPLCIEKAEFFMRTYGYPQVNRQVGDLYLAIIDSLHHILEWYRRAAGLKYLSAFCKGPAYAEMLKTKMKHVETASHAMDERASQREQVRLLEIRNVTLHTNDQVGELKILAVEARNHLYAVLKDTEAWQEALQSWKESRLAEENQRASRDQAMLEQKEKSTTAKQLLLARFDFHHDDQSRDVETVLSQVPSMTLGDQDRVGAVIQHRPVQDWLLDPLFGALLVHGNGRRHDPISPTSVACALLLYVFSKRLFLPTLYWFCGLHNVGPSGNPLGMLQSLICQLLCLPSCRCSIGDEDSLATRDVGNLLKLFRRLLRRSSGGPPIVCILDGLSFYERRHQTDDTGKIVSELASLAQLSPPKLILLLTSPIRTSHVSREPEIAQNLTITEVPCHISGAKQGLDSHQIMASTETRARKLSESFGSGRTPRQRAETLQKSVNSSGQPS